MSTEFGREWALKWTEGVILGFTRNTIKLKRALGMIRRAKTLGVKDDEVLSIINVIETSPVYLPYMTQQQKKMNLKELKNAL